MFPCLLLLAALLAQDPTAGALSGASPYLGAGLLGGVLAWLLFVHLPGKDKQLEKLLKDKDEQVKEMLERERENNKEAAREFREALERVAGHCEGEMAKMAVSWQQQITSLTAAITDLTVKVDNIRYPPRDVFGAPVPNPNPNK